MAKIFYRGPMDKKQFKGLMGRYVEYLESDERKTEFLARIYFLLNGWTVVQEFEIMGSDNSDIH